ncbi:MAG: tRNA (adenosine(37)-N6)-dimethylallyltransferase MiaA [Eubacteriales bacterium]
MDPKIIGVAGPTASGKTALSICLAKRIDGEIISADARQGYKELNIGTAKITEEEKQGINHFMIDVFEPQEDINIAVFTSLSLNYVDQIIAKNKIPIVIGGSGLYMDSILYNSYNFTSDQVDEEYKRYLNTLLTTKGEKYLYNMLETVDEEYAKLTHPNNIKRVKKALEYFHATGRKKSSVVNMGTYRYEDTYYFALFVERRLLYQRIDQRVDEMIRNGFIEEVKKLLSAGYNRSLNSMQAIGYKEIVDALENNLDMQKTIELIKQKSRNYAKRQYTWFKRNKDIRWIDTSVYNTEDSMADYIEGVIYGH